MHDAKTVVCLAQARISVSQPRASRPLANPDLFKATPTTPKSGSRKVSFQDGPAENIDEFHRSSPDPSKQQTSATKKKWQPMAAVAPHPVADNDPFSLGDSDDDDSKKRETKLEDTERLKSATAEAMADDVGDAGKKAPEVPGKVPEDASSIDKVNDTPGKA